MTAALAVVSLGAGSQDARRDTRVLDAASAADTAGVAAWLEQGADANAAQADGATALHWLSISTT